MVSVLAHCKTALALLLSLDQIYSTNSFNMKASDLVKLTCWVMLVVKGKLTQFKRVKEDFLRN